MSRLEDPSLQNLDPQKKEIILDLVQEAKGKPLNQSFSAILGAQARLKSKGLSFSPEETNLLMEVLTKDLSPSEKMKVDAMKNIVKQQTNKS